MRETGIHGGRVSRQNRYLFFGRVAAGQFYYPGYLAISGNGPLYASDSGNFRVYGFCP
jgi:hypothetical protein